jgi:hypothetical protein
MMATRSVLLTAILWGSVAAGAATPVQILTQDGGDYYGHQISAAAFLTCHKAKLPIADKHKITNTDLECGSSVVGPLNGTIERVDQFKRELVIRDDRGTVLTLELTKAEASELRGAKPGDRISIAMVRSNRTMELRVD